MVTHSQTEGKGKLWRRLAQQDRKLMLKLSAVLVAGLLLMGWGRLEAAPAVEPAPGIERAELGYIREEEELAARVEAVLATVKGAGRVRVALTLADSGAAHYAQERESSSEAGAGDSRQQTSQALALAADQPVLLSRSAPAVRGVVVVASGAGDPLVAERLYWAVKSLLAVSGGQIAIIEGEPEAQAEAQAEAQPEALAAPSGERKGRY